MLNDMIMMRMMIVVIIKCKVTGSERWHEGMEHVLWIQEAHAWSMGYYSHLVILPGTATKDQAKNAMELHWVWSPKPKKNMNLCKSEILFNNKPINLYTWGETSTLSLTTWYPTSINYLSVSTSAFSLLLLIPSCLC